MRSSGLLRPRGSDGTVSANKNSIKILGEEPGPARPGVLRLRLQEVRRSWTVSHLAVRAGPASARRYKIGARAVRRVSPVRRSSTASGRARARGTRRDLPAQRAARCRRRPLGSASAERYSRRSSSGRLRLFAIDAYAASRKTSGFGTPYQHGDADLRSSLYLASFRASEAIAANQGCGDQEDVRLAWATRSRCAAQLRRRSTPRSITCTRWPFPLIGRPRLRGRPPIVVGGRAGVRASASRRVMMAGKGDLLPVSAFPPDGTWPVGTAQYEKRVDRARDSASGTRAICVQCNLCSMVCPHAAIRTKAYDPRRRSRERPGGIPEQRSARSPRF